MKAFLKNYPIILTILVLGLTIIISQIVTQLTGHMEYSLILSALIIIGITFLLKMPKEMLVTSKLKVKTLKLYWLPILYILTIPLLTGGYNFSLVTKEILIMMSGVGVFEEVLTHGLCMGLLLNKWGHSKKSVIKAAIVSSSLFGIFHLLAILQDPSNSNLILMKVSTVVFATFIGIGFAGLSYRSNSIWIVAFLHALIDVTAYVGAPNIITNMYSNWSLKMSAIAIAYTFPFAVYGIWLLKKAKPM